MPIIKIHGIDKLSEDKKNYVICMDNFIEGDYTISLPCIHIFHAKCIKKWLMRKKFCPICKFVINKNNLNKISLKIIKNK